MTSVLAAPHYSGPGEHQRFVGLKVLAVEDEPVLLMMLEDMLVDLGCAVAATASNIADALIAIDGRNFDVAILDVTLGNDKIDAAAAAVSARNLPVVFATGHEASEVTRLFGASAVVLQKPYSAAALTAALTKTLARGAA